MTLHTRLRRSIRERGLGGTLAHAPRAALRPLVLAARTRRSAARAPQLVAAAEPALLHLGSGPERLPGWINVDLYFPAELCLDLTRPLPLPDACVDAVYSQHFFEHIDLEAGARLIAQCARVLRPGGWLRISTPDLEGHARVYLRSLEAGETGEQPPAVMLNRVMRMHDHLFIYDFPTLSRLMQDAGLVDVQRAAPQESASPHLQDRETRLREAREGVELELIVEGRRAE